ncbi:ribokinase [Corynebacterium striatum]|uniref:Ribokinase n=1 Tax=Corynebacterium striatum TaxID=43770 RepID=A0AAQ1Z6Q6_CORST|nr:ribokinase [Corynebacterium striatum]EEI78027.1 putative ribokinase [Corynebacterium striatum ATCC 6940]QQE52900.1 ribokinase [Corynebacterium striatum]GEA43084.1 ribokinase [Corynebacterium striatum]STD61381.1 ribokinase [Corynebacterium striatum]
MTAKQPHCVVVGSINADLMISVERHPTPGETLIGSGGEVLAGGKGANQAVAAARQGASVSFVGAVGDDAYAGPAMELLEASGVDLSHVEHFKATTTGLAVIKVAADGENTIVVVPGANARVDAEFVQQHARALHKADMVLLQGEIPAAGFQKAVELARAVGARVVVNLAPVVDVDKQALLQADPLVVNEHEAGLVLKQLGAQTPSDEPEELVECLRAEGFAAVVLTLGARGAIVADAEGTTPIPTPQIKAVDTTGAGDAFTGALVAKLLQGATLSDAAHHAARVGAFAALSRGAQPSYPDLKAQLP